MSGSAPVVRVDTTAVAAASRALDGTARLAHGARAAAARGCAGDGWAVDGPLPTALRRFGDVLDDALARAVAEAREAAARLAEAAAQYEAAETAATVRPLPPVGPGGAADVTAVPGASRDATGPTAG